jgi:hypothetical protein
MKKRGKKRAQITVFVILSIVIVAAVLLAVYFREKKEPAKQQLNIEEINSVLTDCFKSSYKDSLDTIGMQGGYYLEPMSEYLDTGYYQIPFYYFGDITYIPTMDLMREELTTSVNNKVRDCLNILPQYNLNYDYDYKETNITITNNSVKFVTDLDLTITKDGKTTRINFNYFPVEISSRLEDMNDISHYAVYSYKINKQKICISCLTEIADDKKLDIQVLDNIKNVFFVNIVENNSDSHPKVYRYLMTNIPEKIQGLESSIGEYDNPDTDLNLTVPIA